MNVDAREEKKWKQRAGASKQRLPHQEGSSTQGASRREHKSRGGKRVGHQVHDSVAMTKDLHTGELSSSVGRSDTFISRPGHFIYHAFEYTPCPTFWGGLLRLLPDHHQY